MVIENIFYHKAMIKSIMFQTSLFLLTATHESVIIVNRHVCKKFSCNNGTLKFTLFSTPELLQNQLILL